MPDDLFQTLTQYGAIAFVAVAALVLFMAIASTTSIGRAMLPKSVTDVVSNLLPQAWISDVVP